MRRVAALGLALLAIAGPLAVLAVPGPAAGQGVLTTFLTGLSFPTALAFAPDGRVFFVERFSGNVRIAENGTLLPTPFYTLTGTATTGERGLLGLALDPGFPANPWVYAYQTYNDVANGTVYNRIVRILASGNTGLSHEVILRMPPLSGATNHNGGVIAFGPDGALYAVVGENANIPLAQLPSSPMGKVLRMNPDGSAPLDNPFAGNASWHPLVYTYGHRNMFGLAFHPVTGRPAVTENGPGCNDEINLLSGGGNFGWGSSQTCATPPPPPQNTNRDGPNPILPIDWYTPTTAPTNGAFVEGPTFPAWSGDLVFGEWNTGRLRRLELGAPSYDTVLSRQDILTAPSGIVEVEWGPDGAIWFTTPSTIYRYVDANEPPVASIAIAPGTLNPGLNGTFNGTASYDPDGSVVSYDWEFGDGQIGSGPVVDHAFSAPGTYTVTLTVTDDESATSTATGSVRVNAPPSASIAIAPAASHLGETVTFDGTASSDPDDSVLVYAWDFGDGGTATGVVATHAYGSRGRFPVLLTVTDPMGLEAVASSAIDIVNRGPAISATDPAGALTLVVGENRTLSVTASDPDGDPLTYVWEVNGAVVGGNASTFRFDGTAVGPYSVTVTVSDGDLTDSASWEIAVLAGSPPPGGGGDVPVLPIAGAALVLLGAALAAALFLSARRRRRDEPPSPPPPP